MGKIIAGTFNGTSDTTLYIGIGFIPDWVRVWNLEDANENYGEWSKHMRSVEQIAGLQDSASTRTPLTVGTGIDIYEGGVSFATAQTAYLREENLDRDMRDQGTEATITNWTLGSATNKTGNFNFAVNETYVGVGSRVLIRESIGQAVKWATIAAFSSDGSDSNDVTLSREVKTGIVLALHPMYDFTGVAANELMPAGFSITNSTIQGDGEMCMFEAGLYDN